MAFPFHELLKKALNLLRLPRAEALLAHKDVYVLAEQIGVRSQTQYKQEFLSTLYTADRLFGTQCYRPESGVTIAVPN